jgi:hypothetical protein
VEGFFALGFAPSSATPSLAAPIYRARLRS